MAGVHGDGGHIRQGHTHGPFGAFARLNDFFFEENIAFIAVHQLPRSFWPIGGHPVFDALFGGLFESESAALHEDATNRSVGPSIISVIGSAHTRAVGEDQNARALDLHEKHFYGAAIGDDARDRFVDPAAGQGQIGCIAWLGQNRFGIDTVFGAAGLNFRLVITRHHAFSA